MRTFTLKEAEKTDLPLLIEMAMQVWYVTYSSVHSKEQLDYMFDKMYNPVTLLEQMGKGETFFLCYDNGQPAGYCSVEQKEKDLFSLNKLYVLPEYQGTGAGKYMFQASISFIKEHHPGKCILELTVNRKNPAILFYEKMGMERYRESDESIGNGYFMNCTFMRMEI